MRLALQTRLLPFLFLLCLAGSLPAQFGGREISGYVRAQGSAEPPPGTVISLQLSGGGLLEQTTPQGNGFFKFEALQKGGYYVVVRAPGYREASHRVDVIVMPRMTVYFTLVPESREPEAVPELPAEAALIDQRQLRIPEDARKEFERGSRELFEHMKPAAAVPHLRRATEVYPEYYEAFHLLATAYMDQQEWGKAESALKQALEINDAFAPGYTTLAALYNRQSRFAEALPLLDRALSLGAQTWQCHLEMARSLMGEGAFDKAEPHAAEAHRLAPEFPLVHLVLGNLALQQHDLRRGRDEFQHFLELVPTGPLADTVRAKLAEIETVLSPSSSEKHPQP